MKLMKTGEVEGGEKKEEEVRLLCDYSKHADRVLDCSRTTALTENEHFANAG